MDINRISASSTFSFDPAKAKPLAGTTAQTNGIETQDTSDNKALVEKEKSKALSEADAAQLAKLQARDREVRQHETHILRQVVR